MRAYEFVFENEYFDNDPEKLKDFLLKVTPYFERKYGSPVGKGRARIVYGNDRVIFKLPLNSNGVFDNKREWDKYRKSGYYNPEKYKEELRKMGLTPSNDFDDQIMNYARCRIKYVDGIPIIVMEKLKTDIPWNDMPKWANYIDSGQVGKDKHGKFKAYDYAESAGNKTPTISDEELKKAEENGEIASYDETDDDFREPQLPPLRKYYHGTTLENAKKILKNGLKTRFTLDRGEYSKGFIFLSPSRKGAERFAPGGIYGPKKGIGVILEIIPPPYLAKKIRTDLGEFPRSPADIPPQFIRFIKYTNKRK